MIALKDRLLLDEVAAKIICRYVDLLPLDSRKGDAEIRSLKVELYDFMTHTKDEELQYVKEVLKDDAPVKLSLIFSELLDEYYIDRYEHKFMFFINKILSNIKIQNNTKKEQKVNEENNSVYR